MAQQIEQKLMELEAKQNLKRLTDILHIRFPEVFEDRKANSSETD